MGPMLMTGLGCFGAAVAIGLLVDATSRPTTPVVGPVPARSLAVISIAIAVGSGVLGVVVGLVAIQTGAVIDPASGVFAAAPAVVGFIVGVVLIVRGRRDVDPAVTAIAVPFLIGQATLGPVVAALAIFIPAESGPVPTEWPFVVLGLVLGASALGIGLTGSRTLRAMKGVDDTTAKVLTARQISMGLPFQLGGIAATAIAILLIVMA